jgi:hypothetical protein
MSELPQALQMAELLNNPLVGLNDEDCTTIADELQRLHSENASLRRENAKLYGWLLEEVQFNGWLKAELEHKGWSTPRPLTDELITKCMMAVNDPVQWGRLGADRADMIRQFAHAIAAGVAGVDK